MKIRFSHATIMWIRIWQRKIERISPNPENGHFRGFWTQKHPSLLLIQVIISQHSNHLRDDGLCNWCFGVVQVNIYKKSVSPCQKAGYTATQAACGWAGAVLRQNTRLPK